MVSDYTPKKIKEIYERAIAGDKDAQFEMAVITANGVDGVIVADAEISRRWLHHAASNGSKDAQVWMAHVIFEDFDSEKILADVDGYHWLRMALENSSSFSDLSIDISDDDVASVFERCKSRVREAVKRAEEYAANKGFLTKTLDKITGREDFWKEFRHFLFFADNADKVLAAERRSIERFDSLSTIGLSILLSELGMWLSSPLAKLLQPTLKGEKLEKIIKDQAAFWEEVVAMPAEEKSMFAAKLMFFCTNNCSKQWISIFHQRNGNLNTKSCSRGF